MGGAGRGGSSGGLCPSAADHHHYRCSVAPRGRRIARWTTIVPAHRISRAITANPQVDTAGTFGCSAAATAAWGCGVAAATDDSDEQTDAKTFGELTDPVASQDFVKERAKRQPAGTPAKSAFASVGPEVRASVFASRVHCVATPSINGAISYVDPGMVNRGDPSMISYDEHGQSRAFVDPASGGSMAEDKAPCSSRYQYVASRKVLGIQNEQHHKTSVIDWSRRRKPALLAP